MRVILIIIYIFMRTRSGTNIDICSFIRL